MNDLERLATEPVLQGVLWSWIVPAALFLLAFVATWMLYRHFANAPRDEQ